VTEKTWRCTTDPTCFHNGMICCGDPTRYTEATLQLVTEALASRKYSDSFEEDARHLLDELFEAGLLIPPLAQEDIRRHARAYLYTRPDGKQLVLDPAHVTVVLPGDAP
jgi:hypothetical protein